MKILVLSQYFWPETFRITEVVKSLRDEGCDVTVLTGQPNYPEGVIQSGYSAASLRKEVRDGLTIFRVPLVLRGRGSSVQLALNYLSFVVSAAVFGVWLLRGRKFDVVLVYAPSPILQALPAIWLARLKSAKIVTWVQDLWPESLRATGHVHNPKVLASVAAVVRWIYRHNDLLLVQSKAFIEPVARMAGGTPVEYHPNPGELAFSIGNKERKLALRLSRGFNVVFAGNLGSVQALDTVLAAAVLLRGSVDIRFILIGSGSRRDWVQDEIQRLGLENVLLPGRFPQDDMPGILAQASALLVSLKRDPIMSQTVPSKVQAYLAAGRPIIASLDGEGAQVVEDAGAGVSCPAEDAKALSEAVRRLHALPSDARDSMGLLGRRYYEEHFEPGMLAKRLSQRMVVLAANCPTGTQMGSQSKGHCDDR